MNTAAERARIVAGRLRGLFATEAAAPLAERPAIAAAIEETMEGILGEERQKGAEDAELLRNVFGG